MHILVNIVHIIVNIVHILVNIVHIKANNVDVEANTVDSVANTVKHCSEYRCFTKHYNRAQYQGISLTAQIHMYIISRLASPNATPGVEATGLEDVGM